jgi:multidrug efflux pump subunit AcrA (membrane-fusion protein)
MAGRSFTGKVVRRSESIDPGSRTLLTEVDFDNRKGEVLPGSFVQLNFKLGGGVRASSVVVPVSALIFRSEGLQVAVVRDNKAVLVPVTMGRDFGNTVELSSGVTTGDLVINNPADSLASGTTVQVQEAKQPAAQAETKPPAKAAETKHQVKGAK